VAIAGKVAERLERLPTGFALVIQARGGRPVYDLFAALAEAKGLPATLHGISTTAGVDGLYHVGEAVLVATVEVLLQQRRLHFDATHPDVPVFLEELRNYRRKRSAGAPSRLLAVATACWWAENACEDYRGPLVYNTWAPWPGDAEAAGEERQRPISHLRGAMEDRPELRRWIEGED
jgi:hypothetical protein